MAARCSNVTFTVVNVLALLLGVASLAAGIYLAAHGGATQCEKTLQTPALILGAVLLVLAAAGVVGACCRASFLLWIYLFVLLLLVIAFIALSVFAFVITNRGAGHAVSNAGFLEYRLSDYSSWLQNQVDNQKNWDTISSCLQEAKVCQSMPQKNETEDQFWSRSVNPLQSGCCKPPRSCNFTFVSATNWTKTSSPAAGDNPDCGRWSNDEGNLCFGCDSCKAGVIANLKDNWKTIAFVNIGILVFLIVVYTVGCCALRNNRRGYSPVGKP